MILQRVTDSTAAVSLSDAKEWLRVEAAVTEDDDLITALTLAATVHAEQVCNRQLVDADFILNLDQWPECVRLPMGRVSAVTAVKYLDTDEVEQTLAAANYETDLVSTWKPGLRRSYQGVYPSLGKEPNPVRIEYTAGYGTAADVPETIVTAIKMHVAQLYENREISANINQMIVPQGYHAILNQHRIGL